MNRIAIVVQRYSEDVNGGAELHARLLAEHLSEKYDVEVLTSCAKDYLTWDNYYPEGVELINNIKVIRFESEKKDKARNKEISRYLHRNLKYGKAKVNLKNFLYIPVKKLLYKCRKNHNKLFDEWIEKQGPLCKGLVSYINECKDKYTAFIFFTYLYYPTYIGIQDVGYKSILIPTAHDEPPFYFSGFSRLFSHPKFIMYNTLSEKKLVETTYPQTQVIASDIAGVGFNKSIIDTNYTKEQHIDYKYFLYIGRIDINKGCKELINYFEYFLKENNSNVKLVMIGSNQMTNVKFSSDIIFTGYIDEQEKLSYLNNCEALIIPSRFESLSMVTLESMYMGKPVLANGVCEVLKEHIESSKAGFLYYNRKDFCLQLNKILNISMTEKDSITNNGIFYVEENYNWKNIISKFTKAIETVIQ